MFKNQTVWFSNFKDFNSPNSMRGIRCAKIQDDNNMVCLHILGVPAHFLFVAHQSENEDTQRVLLSLCDSLLKWQQCLPIQCPARRFKEHFLLTLLCHLHDLRKYLLKTNWNRKVKGSRRKITKNSELT